MTINAKNPHICKEELLLDEFAGGGVGTTIGGGGVVVYTMFILCKLIY
jgi:hypothetical protein